jgi:voltage-gated potassium channel Kch
MDTFVVQFWGRVLATLRWLSPLELIWLAAPQLRTHGWVDVWVLLNLAISVLTLLLATHFGPSCSVAIALVIYGAIRIFEIVVYQAKVVLFDPYRQPRLISDFAVRSYRRIVVLALHNYLETVFWFAAIYSVFRYAFGEKAQVLSSAIGALYFSMGTMVTLGYGEITPTDDYGRAVVFVHLLVAIFMTLVILARFVAFLPVPRTLDDTERPPS